MTRPEDLTLLELEHIIRYGTWEEQAAYDPLPDTVVELSPPDLEAGPEEIGLSSDEIEILIESFEFDVDPSETIKH